MILNNAKTAFLICESLRTPTPENGDWSTPRRLFLARALRSGTLAARGLRHRPEMAVLDKSGIDMTKRDGSSYSCG